MFRRLRADRRGVAGLEAALALGFVLIPLCLGMTDIAAEINEAARLDRALQAATFYVWANPTGFTNAGVQNAANAGYGSAAPALTTGTATSCSCVTSSYNPQSATSCTSTCPTGQQLASYLTISASASLTLPAPLPALTSPAALSVQGTIRTQ